jgi:hypothetical protein
MNKTELRIGSIVKLRNRVVVISELLNDQCTVLHTEEEADTVESYDSLEPLAIDTDILIGLGFEQVSGVILDSFFKQVKCTMAKQESLELSLNSDETGYYYVAFRQGDFTDRDLYHNNDLVLLRRDMMYVHDLQNLYNSLTKLELTLNGKE